MHTWLAAAQARGETQRLQLAAASQAADARKDASGRGEGAMACDDEFDSCAVLAAMDDTSGSPAEPGQTRQPPPPPATGEPCGAARAPGLYEAKAKAGTRLWRCTMVLKRPPPWPRPWHGGPPGCWP